MDRVRNPFTPGAGSPPPLLARREAQIEAMSIAVQRMALGRFERSISAAMGKVTNQTGPIRDSLIKRGLCYAPRHGLLAFTVPMFDQFVRRALP